MARGVRRSRSRPMALTMKQPTRDAQAETFVPRTTAEAIERRCRGKRGNGEEPMSQHKTWWVRPGAQEKTDPHGKGTTPTRDTIFQASTSNRNIFKRHLRKTTKLLTRKKMIRERPGRRLVRREKKEKGMRTREWTRRLKIAIATQSVRTIAL